MRILLIDGMNLFIRNYVVVPEMDVNGDHVGGALGSVRSIRLLLEQISPTHALFVWEGEGGSQRRRGIMAEYKEGRKPRVNREYEFDETPERAQENFRNQLKRLSHYLKLLGITQLKVDGSEADDVIAYVAGLMYPEAEKVIVSTDKDYYQLISEKVRVYSPSQKVMYTPEIFLQKFGVLPSNYIYMKMMVGDGVDNIEGIDGVGVKTVAKLFPFLAERDSSFQEVITHAETSKGPKYRKIWEERDRLAKNVALMQLNLPMVGPHALTTIRDSIEGDAPELVLSELKLNLIRDGIQVRDRDLFGAFREYNMRRRKS